MVNSEAPVRAALQELGLYSSYRDDFDQAHLWVLVELKLLREKIKPEDLESDEMEP